MARFCVYGLVIESDWPITTELVRTDDPPDLTFHCERARPRPLDCPVEILHESNRPGLDGESLITLFRDADGTLGVRYSGTADFLVGAERIECRLFDPDWEFWIEIALLGPILALWLELQCRIAFHASAVVEAPGAWGFLAGSRAGKSGLAAGFVEAGARFLTDDILALQFGSGRATVFGGPPSFRLWPQHLRSLGVGPERHPRAHPHFEKRRVPAGRFGRLHDGPARLAALFLPIRDRSGADGSVALRRLPAAEAVGSLAEGAFARGIIERVPELQAERLRLLAAVVREIPIYELHYPDGLKRVSDVREELLRQFSGPSGATPTTGPIATQP